MSAQARENDGAVAEMELEDMRVTPEAILLTPPLLKLTTGVELKLAPLSVVLKPL
jgi:hypothetical protein